MGWKWFDGLKKDARTRWAKLNNRAFKDAAMSAVALVAAADGAVSKEEEDDVVALIAANDLLQVFDAAELGALFRENCAKAKDKFARLNLLSAVRKLKGAEGAETVAQVCCLVGASDGDFDDKEKAVVREICAALGLESADYV